uniref:Uncharacterized protein n=1 Tax=Siphoviridae sp. ct3o911 TaxID=2827560 RepID=A0A8S5LJY7_9CAUD|nr:MAG TPA: hypothetical protein [Siphoviridae sp. ct3o911]
MHVPRALFIYFLSYYRRFCSFANLRVLCMVMAFPTCYNTATIKHGEQAEQPALDNSPQHTTHERKYTL